RREVYLRIPTALRKEMANKHAQHGTHPAPRAWFMHRTGSIRCRFKWCLGLRIDDLVLDLVPPVIPHVKCKRVIRNYVSGHNSLRAIFIELYEIGVGLPCRLVPNPSRALPHRDFETMIVIGVDALHKCIRDLDIAASGHAV